MCLVQVENIRLGKGVINTQKFLPFRLKIQSFILTRSEFSKSSLGKNRWMAKKIDATQIWGFKNMILDGPFGSHLGTHFGLVQGPLGPMLGPVGSGIGERNKSLFM